MWYDAPMADDREKSRGGMGGAILLVMAVLFLLPVLYVLSCGPAVALMTRGYMSQEAFQTTYTPLRIAAQSSSWIGRTLERYAELWAASRPAPAPPPASVATPNPAPAPMSVPATSPPGAP